MARSSIYDASYAFSRALIQYFLGITTNKIAVDLLDVASSKIKEEFNQRRITRQFEDIADRICRHLLSNFSKYEKEIDVDISPIVSSLSDILNNHLSSSLLIENNLSSRKIFVELKQRSKKYLVGLNRDEIAVFDKFLHASITHLVESASTLPNFNERSVEEILNRVDGVKEDIEAILEKVERIISRTLIEENIDDVDKRYEIDYRSAMQRNLDYVELFGADIADTARRNNLSVAYISLKVKGPDTFPVTAEDFFNRITHMQKRVVIRGEAGAGKSTLLRWLVLQACAPDSLQDKTPKYLLDNIDRLLTEEETSIIENLKKEHLEEGIIDDHESGESAQSRRKFDESFNQKGDLVDNLISENQEKAGILESVNDRAEINDLIEERKKEAYYLQQRTMLGKDWNEKIPFLIQLRHCKGEGIPDPENIPGMIAKELGQPPSKRWVRSFLERGDAIVLLDGIDEFPKGRRSELKIQLKNFVHQYPECIYIVTTRPTAIPRGWLRELDFLETELAPLSDIDKFYLIERWHAALSAELRRRQQRDEDLFDLCNSLQASLPESPHLNRLASNPLICAMICAIHHGDGRYLPESMGDLCERLCRMFLIRDQQARIDSHGSIYDDYSKLSFEQKRAIIQDIAEYMITEEVSTIETSLVRYIIGESLSSLRAHENIDLNSLTSAVIERSGVLREKRPGWVDFIHNTFREFLAAERLVAQRKVNVVAKNALDAAWQPVALMAASTRDKEFATLLVRRILGYAKKASSKRKRRQWVMMALRCLGVALHFDPDLRNEITGRVKVLFPPKNLEEAESLAAGGDGVVPFLSVRNLSADHASACVRTLGLIGTKRAREAFNLYVNDRRKAVVNELIRYTNPLNLRLVQKIVQEEGYIQASIAERIRSLEPLFKLGEIEKLNLSGTRIVSLMGIEHKAELKWINLAASKVKDISLLKLISNLQWLNLSFTGVSDFSSLKYCQNLEYLDLEKTGIEDFSIFKDMNKLKKINLAGTKFSDFSCFESCGDIQLIDLRDTEVRNFEFLYDRKKPIRVYLSEEIYDCINIPRDKKEIFRIQTF